MAQGLASRFGLRRRQVKPAPPTMSHAQRQGGEVELILPPWRQAHRRARRVRSALKGVRHVADASASVHGREGMAITGHHLANSWLRQDPDCHQPGPQHCTTARTLGVADGHWIFANLRSPADWNIVRHRASGRSGWSNGSRRRACQCPRRALPPFNPARGNCHDRLIRMDDLSGRWTSVIEEIRKDFQACTVILDLPPMLAR